MLLRWGAPRSAARHPHPTPHWLEVRAGGRRPGLSCVALHGADGPTSLCPLGAGCTDAPERSAMEVTPVPPERQRRTASQVRRAEWKVCPVAAVPPAVLTAAARAVSWAPRPSALTGESRVGRPPASRALSQAEAEGLLSSPEGAGGASECGGSTVSPNVPEKRVSGNSGCESEVLLK